MVVGVAPSEYNAEPIAEWTLDLPFELDVVDASEELVEVVPDPSLADAIKRSISIDLIHSGYRTVGGCGSDSAGARHRTYGLPANVAFDVFGRRDGVERQLTTICASRRIGAGGEFHYSRSEFFPDAETIDLVLRSNPRVAEESLDITLIWGGEIVYEDAPLREDPFDEVSEEEQARQIVRHLEIHFDWSHSQQEESFAFLRLIYYVYADELPVDLAFDAFGILDGEEVYMGAFRLQPGGWGDFDSVMLRRPAGWEPPEKLTVILRATDPPPAWREGRAIELWRGEIVIEDVPVICMNAPQADDGDDGSARSQD
jgi:hypothetical protein